MKACVCIPVLNGETYLDQVITAALQQRADFKFEVLVIDSGSKDRSLEIIKSHPVKLHQIPNREFGHGKTRNLAFSLTDADYVLFLTQDAIPASPKWLANLIKPHLDDLKVAASYGGQIPRLNVDPRTGRILRDVYQKRSNHSYTFDTISDDHPVYSDINACLSRRSWKRIPFRDVSYAEDFYMYEDIIRSGYSIAYVAEASVIHSNDLNMRDNFGRMIDEVNGLPKSKRPPSRKWIAKITVYEIIKNCLFSLTDLPLWRLPYNLIFSVVSELQRTLALYSLYYHPKLFSIIRKHYSLEKIRKHV